MISSPPHREAVASAKAGPVAIIEVRAEPGDESWVRLARILEHLIPIRFVTVEGEPQPGAVGALVTERALDLNSGSKAEKGSTFRKPPTERAAGQDDLAEVRIKIHDDAEAPFPFRGKTLNTMVPSPVRVLKLSKFERALASCEEGVMWAVSDANGVKSYRSAFPIPALRAGGSLIEVLNGDRFFEMLPLLHWLRNICPQKWEPSTSLRASFIFDDPNLHWPSYGFVNYREIAARARKENFHVGFATIPLDAWFTHRGTAEMFRTNSDRLSLLIHGNNHTRHELARERSQPSRLTLLRQAIRRISQLERRTGLQVCRVMVPPQGACAEAMLQELPGCGFEGACISHGSLKAHNQAEPWTQSLGYAISEIIKDCPVLPRWGFSKNTKCTIWLAAFLGQAIIFRGHHQDLKEGLEVLDEHARVINDLGPVQWRNLTDLCRMNYQSRTDGLALKIRPFGRLLEVQIAREVAGMAIEPGHQYEQGWRISGDEMKPQDVVIGQEISISRKIPQSMRVEVANAASLETAPVNTFPGAWPMLRRLLTETRDRVL